MKQPLPILVGPTASGKTALSILIAEKMGSPIISADSVQVYEHVNIGSAKPTEEERKGIHHDMIDVIPLDEDDFSASQYREMAAQCIDHWHVQGKVPLVVGGTGFYIRSLTDDMNFGMVSKDDSFRAIWEQKEKEDPQCAYRELVRIDPVSANRLHPNDRGRVIRALEVYHLTGQPMSEYRQERKQGPYQTPMAGLTMPREQLYERIEQRVDIMFAQGLIEEMESVLSRGYDSNLPALQTIGYKEVGQYLQGKMTEEEAKEAIKLATRHYAKRQGTWFRREQQIRWFDYSHYGTLEEMAEEIIRFYQDNVQ